jgi:hypothetical protein
MARLETPLARATSDMPPRPWAALSAAAHNRRERSSSHASNREKRCLISPSLATRTFYGINDLIATLIFLQSLREKIPADTHYSFVNRFRTFWRWLLYTDASGYLQDARAQQAGDRAAHREESWYGDPYRRR